MGSYENGSEVVSSAGTAATAAEARGMGAGVFEAETESVERGAEAGAAAGDALDGSDALGVDENDALVGRAMTR